ncbi:hypothetical protein [Halostagnicola sp. A56]|uniref:hypothetical protein n=1 Tax=Halostagnicola sp. A56 TaxID=1495067 RepID=UPI000AB54A32|nr:hypothetical protein [Halostagnicola sp. A56]
MSDGSIEAEKWDSAQEWTTVGLSKPADVDLYDVDIAEIGMVRDRVQLTFDVDGDLFALDAILQTGAESILWDNPDPDRQGPIPAGLEDWLAPIASERYVDPNSSKGLVRRQDVRVTSQ